MKRSHPSSFAEFLVENRRKAGLDATLASAKCGVSKFMWSRFENDNRVPNAAALYAISRLFQVPMETLFELSRPTKALEILERVKR